MPDLKFAATLVISAKSELLLGDIYVRRGAAAGRV